MVYFKILWYDTSTEENQLEVFNMIALQWQAQVLSLLDQSKYPAEEVWVDCSSVEEVAKALSDGANMLPLSELRPLLTKLIRIRRAIL